MIPSSLLALSALLSLFPNLTPIAVRPGSDITFKNARLLYHGQLFTGIIVEHFPHVGTTRETRYRRGWVDGEQKEFHSNGTLVARLRFSEGEKVGTHEGWFANGKRRFHYEYKNGVHDRESWEWYDTGTLSQYMRFEGGLALGKKMWRRDGQIYMNYVFSKSGEAVGVPGTSLCLQLRDGKI